jgi:hypothetical protein
MESSQLTWSKAVADLRSPHTRVGPLWGPCRQATSSLAPGQVRCRGYRPLRRGVADAMNRVALVARLKPGAQAWAVRAGAAVQPGRTRPRPARRVPVGGEVVFVFEGGEVEWMPTRSSTSRLERSRRRSGRCASSSRIRESRRPSTPRKATRTSQSAVSGRDGQQRPATCHRPWWPIADLEHA